MQEDVEVTWKLEFYFKITTEPFTEVQALTPMFEQARIIISNNWLADELDIGFADTNYSMSIESSKEQAYMDGINGAGSKYLIKIFPDYQPVIEVQCSVFAVETSYKYSTKGLAYASLN